ncbi:hypothetical protein SAY87_014718 [Trapa incisa]|uniref:Uncharacterized protein n=1 Tax=Trapa incisa TaxID=236973 RepID=A0AAN7JKR2_9MYRT|nr:hypothetical protein SAY87_014718 [Trapa incisa]
MGGRSDANDKWTVENSDCRVRTPTGRRGGVDFGGEIDGDEVMGEGRNGDPEVASFGLGEERNMYNFNQLIWLADTEIYISIYLETGEEGMDA